MGYIKVDDLIANMTPEQKILVQQFYARFDVGSGIANRKILNVEPLYYDGLIAGSEFETYAATKMYISLQFAGGILAANISGAVTAYISFYDEANAISFSLNNLANAFNVASIYVVNNVFNRNDDFSRIVTAGYTYMKFLGYRVTLGTV
jgi:hypothetical protein